MNKFENIMLRCIRFLFGRWLSDKLKLELDEMINPVRDSLCCDVVEEEPTCKCGHLENSHTNDKYIIEGCRDCKCEKFALEEKSE